ncbi:MAG: CvpA family protein [Muribaculaceae bacterium]|nr:CvpA family protein [Muribaculaceae bacterium]
MSVFTIVTILIALVGLVLGYRSGLVAQVGQIIGLLGAIVACRMFGPVAMEWLGPRDPSESSTALTAVAYAITFLVVYFAVLFVVRLIRGVVRSVHLGVIDRIAGAIFRAFVYLLLFSIVLNVWAVVAPGSDLINTRVHPERARVIAIAPAVCGYMVDHATNP